jgi:predicted nucleic acid-binding Zn ribbon protein
MNNDNFSSLKTLMHQFLRERGLEHKIKELSVPTYWREAVGEQVDKVSTVKYFDDGKLFVEVRASVWRTELLLRREDIRRKINERCGSELVKEIIVR